MPRTDRWVRVSRLGASRGLLGVVILGNDDMTLVACAAAVRVATSIGFRQ